MESNSDCWPETLAFAVRCIILESAVNSEYCRPEFLDIGIWCCKKALYWLIFQFQSWEEVIEKHCARRQTIRHSINKCRTWADFEFQPYCCSSLLPCCTVLASLSSSVLLSGDLDLTTSPAPLGCATKDKRQSLLRKGSPNHEVGTMLSEISEPTHVNLWSDPPSEINKQHGKDFRITLTECQLFL